jgi:hypothetical protein
MRCIPWTSTNGCAANWNNGNNKRIEHLYLYNKNKKTRKDLELAFIAIFSNLFGFLLAAEEGFEPSQTESESVVLPLHNSAQKMQTLYQAVIIISYNLSLVNRGGCSF